MVTVAARTAVLLPAAATTRDIPMRSGTSVRAGSYAYDATDVTRDWHVHDLHQIEYACQGVVEVETASARYLLPPQRAAWIPAGLSHKTTLKRVRTVSVFFDPGMMPDAAETARILTVQPLLREMITYAARWPIGRAEDDPHARGYFRTLADVVLEALEHESPYSLPTATDPLVADAMRYTDEHLEGVVLADVCRAVAASERTVRRRFLAATDLTWRDYLLRSRLLRAMTLLSESDLTVLGVATRVGFDSPSAFSRAFVQYTRETPTAYRRRTR